METRTNIIHILVFDVPICAFLDMAVVLKRGSEIVENIQHRKTGLVCLYGIEQSMECVQ